MQSFLNKKTIIVIPVANEEKTITRLIDQFLNLDVVDFQVFIMDRYSKDRTMEIITHNMKNRLMDK